MLVFAFGCSDSTSPEENKLLGKWKSENFMDANIGLSFIVIEFSSDKRFIMTVDVFKEPEILEEGSYSIDGNEIVIESGQCENIKGKYRFEFKNNGIEFYLIDDKCNRKKYMTSFFDKYEGPFVSPNPITNDVRE